MKHAPCLLLLAACAAPPPPPPKPDPAIEEVSVEIWQMYADLSARDWEKFAGHFAEGAVVIFKTRKGVAQVTSIVDFNARNQKAVAGKEVFGEDCEGLDVRVHRDLAHAWSRFRGRVGTKEKVDTWSGIDAYTLLRLDGKWKIVAIAVSVDE